MKNPLLIFDLGNVLVRHDNALLEQRILAECTAPGAKAVLDTALSSHHGMSIGTSTLAKFFAEFQPAAGFQGDFARFEALWNSHFDPAPGMEELVEKLAAKYRTAILSNTNQSHWNHIIANYPIMRRPHALYASFQMGVAKPDAAIYRQVLAAEGTAPENAIFIDDVVANVEGARAVGMTALHFVDRPTLELQLAKLGIHA